MWKTMDIADRENVKGGKAEMPDNAEKLIYLKISRMKHNIWGWETGNYGR